MAKIAVRSYMESLLLQRRNEDINADAVFIVGKGKGSEGKPVLMPAIMQLLCDDYCVDAAVDPINQGRIRVSKDSIERFIKRKRWRV